MTLQEQIDYNERIENEISDYWKLYKMGEITLKNFKDIAKELSEKYI
jgi:hypothetical protein